MKNFNFGHGGLCYLLTIIASLLTREVKSQSVELFSDSIKIKKFVPVPQTIANSITPIVIKSLDKVEAKSYKGAFVFGKKIPVNLTQNDFKLIFHDIINNTNIWAIKTKVENATNTDVLFQNVTLTDSSYLFVSTPNGNQACGPYTKNNIPITKKYYSATFSGSELLIFLVEKGQLEKPLSHFEIAGLTLGVADPRSNPMARVASIGPNATCKFPQVETISSAVVYYVIEGKNGARSSCTGTLINNENQDRTPYLLTARHCITDSELDTDLSSTEKAYVQSLTGSIARRIESCNGSNEENFGLVTGATFKSAWFYTDFALFELNSNNLPLNPNVNYSSWTRDSFEGNGTMIAHPNSQPQKYSLGSKAGSSPDPWKYKITWAIGDGDNGSSGGALYNDNGKIVGINSYGLFGENLFGKFSDSWESGANSERRLRPYLSPNQNLQSINFLVPTAMQVSNRSVLCYGSTTTISMPNLRPTEVVTWNVGPAGSNLTIVSITNNSVTVTPSSPSASGLGIVTATIANEQKIQYLTVGVPEKATTRIYNFTTQTLTDLKDNQSVNFCTDQDNYLNVQNINYGEGGDIATSAEWTFPGTWSPTTAYGGIYGDAVGVNTSFYGGVFTIKLGNACGVQQSPTYVGINMNYCSGYYRYSIYPNPTSDNLVVEFENTDEQKHFPESIELISEDTKGGDKAVRSWAIGDDKKSKLKQSKHITFDVKDVPRGRYILRVKTEHADTKIQGYHVVLE